MTGIASAKIFEEYISRWALVPDGNPIVTRSSRLLPVCHDGLPAMLKVSLEAEEKLGSILMAYWDGEGAARVLAHDGDAILLERAENKISLGQLANTGRDEEATRILCSAVARLHAQTRKPLPELIPPPQWFEALEPAAGSHGGILSQAAGAARTLLASPGDVVALHGDIHHGNVLDFGVRGWLAIDPKGLLGERGFDYANLFCNPDQAVATSPATFARRVDIVSAVAQLERDRLLQWILAWTGLSAAWILGDGDAPDTHFAVAELAAAELAR